MCGLGEGALAGEASNTSSAAVSSDGSPKAKKKRSKFNKDGTKRASGFYKTGEYSNRYNFLSRCTFSSKALARLKRVLDWSPSLKWMPDGRWVIVSREGGRRLIVEDFLTSFD